MSALSDSWSSCQTVLMEEPTRFTIQSTSLPPEGLYLLFVTLKHCFLFISLQILAVLSQDGVMRFININTHKLLFCIGSHDDGITTAAVSPNGRYVVTTMNNGSINIYCTRSLTREVNKVALNCDTRSYVMAKILQFS